MCKSRKALVFYLGRSTSEFDEGCFHDAAWDFWSLHMLIAQLYKTNFKRTVCMMLLLV